MALSHVRIGISVENENIRGVVISPNNEVLSHVKVQLQAATDNYETILMAIADTVSDLEETADFGTASVGIGLPGTVIPKTGLLCDSLIPCLDGHPVRDDLTKLLRRLVRCSSNSVCFGIAEAIDGAGLGSKALFCGILDTRCAGTFVFNRRLVSGLRATSGGWAHNPFPYRKPEEQGEAERKCWCGKTQCIETWISSDAVTQDFFRETQQNWSIEQIISNQENDNHAKSVLTRHAERLAQALAMVINTVDPELIVLGGPLSENAHLYTQLPGLIEPCLFLQNQNLNIRRAQHKEDAKAQGAARLWEVA